MAELVLAVMAVAAVLYAVLAGADFGAGLIEGFVPEDERERVDIAITPVWEANHVWLVLIAVLAFVGFPALYGVVCTYLHIPILLVLLGIVARGTAFTFRHYDPDPARFARSYSTVFRFGSFLSPFALGLIMATIASGRLVAKPELGFYAVFVAPWNTWFAWSTGLFVCALFAFEGAALLAAENATRGATLPYLRIARRAHLFAMATGACVFASAYFERVPWLEDALSKPLFLGCMLFATLLTPAVAHAFHRGHPWRLRLATGAQVSAILVGFFAAQFPVLVRIAPHDITFPEAAAGEATLAPMIVALVIGLALIVPATVMLIRVYKVVAAAPQSSSTDVSPPRM